MEEIYIFSPGLSTALRIEMLAYMDINLIGKICLLDKNCKGYEDNRDLWIRKLQLELVYFNITESEIKRVFNLFGKLGYIRAYELTLAYFIPEERTIDIIDYLIYADQGDRKRLLSMGTSRKRPYISVLYLYYLKYGIDKTKTLLNSMEFSIPQMDYYLLDLCMDDDIIKKLKENRTKIMMEIINGEFKYLTSFKPTGGIEDVDLFKSLYNGCGNETLSGIIAKIFLGQQLSLEEIQIFEPEGDMPDRQLYLYYYIIYKHKLFDLIDDPEAFLLFIDYFRLEVEEINIYIHHPESYDNLISRLSPKLVEKIAKVTKDHMSIKIYKKIIDNLSIGWQAHIFESLLTEEDIRTINQNNKCKYKGCTNKRDITNGKIGDYCYSHTPKSRLRNKKR
jgi:hypothetical protein